MGGGLLNLVSEGNKNIFLNGNPKKTFFNTKYQKYTNFGMEKLRLDVNGSRQLKMTTDAKFLFNIRNYGDLLMDTYFIVSLPNIWSPIVEFDLSFDDFFINTDNEKKFDFLKRNKWPYEFKWIENLGSQMVRNVKYIIGSTVIQEFTGEYLYNMVNRDFSKEKKFLFDEMTGNTKELNDPANYGGRNNNYPNAIYNEYWNEFGPEPSIRARNIYVPLNISGTLNSKFAFPLLCLNKQNLKIEITCRPIIELFVVKYIPTQEILKDFNNLMLRVNTSAFKINDADDWDDIERKQILDNCQLIGQYVQANQNEHRYLFYHFVNPPHSPNKFIDNGTITGTNEDLINYKNNTKSIWNADAHLLCNYVFLSEQEQNVFKNRKQKYLIKYVNEKDYLGLQGSSIIRLINEGLVTSWMWFLQRSDVNIRNQWSNYTNWSDSNLPFKNINNIIGDHKDFNLNSFIYNIFGNQIVNTNGVANYDNVKIKNFDNRLLNINTEDENISSNISITSFSLQYNKLPNAFNISGPYRKNNNKNILKSASIVLNGKIRENFITYNIFNQIESYLKTNGSFKDGLLYYNFCLNTDISNPQPSGAINLSKYNSVDMHINLIDAEKDPLASTKILVDNSGEMIGINRSEWNIFKYTFRLHFMQEKYVLLTIDDGNISLDKLV